MINNLQVSKDTINKLYAQRAWNCAINSGTITELCLYWISQMTGGQVKTRKAIEKFFKLELEDENEQ